MLRKAKKLYSYGIIPLSKHNKKLLGNSSVTHVLFKDNIRIANGEIVVNNAITYNNSKDFEKLEAILKYKEQFSDLCKKIQVEQIKLNCIHLTTLKGSKWFIVEKDNVVHVYNIDSMKLETDKDLAAKIITKFNLIQQY